MDNKNSMLTDSHELMLKQIKAYADEIKKMHTEMHSMLKECVTIKSEFDAIQQEKVQEKMLKLASKAAKKAAKKSIAKAKIKDKLYRRDIDAESID